MQRPVRILLAAIAILLPLDYGQALAGSAGVEVERMSSKRATIRFVQTEVRDGELRVRGSVSHRIPMRGAIPGHVRITLRDPSGRVLDETDASMMRPNRQSQFARFHATLPVDAPSGSVLTVAHRPDH